VTTGVRGVSVREPLVGIDVSDPQAIQTGPLKRLLLPLSRRLAADVALPIRTLDIDPPLLYEALRYYHQHPQARAELATQAGLTRIQHGQFPPTQPAGSDPHSRAHARSLTLVRNPPAGHPPWWVVARAVRGPMPPILALRRVSVCVTDPETEAMAGSESFEEFYTGAVGRLLGQLFPVTGDLHEAEEVAQEAFARASVRWTRLRDYDVPEAWVRRVAMRLAADRARSLRRQTRAILKLSPPREVPAVSVEALALAEALRTLPIRQRQVIVLHHLVDLPVEEVARTLAIPDGTVKSLLARGRKALAAKLAEPEEVLYPG
jgi:RNA polymerase sigma-70 factor, ECF subfamily